ncbi:MAG TPA: YciI family protein [Candidatus Acidoferrales bacterium]
MPKQHYFMRLVPPRPIFPGSMTPEELALMGRHKEYVAKAFDAGKVLAYGPVLDPAGAFGIALLEMNDLAEAEDFARNDPSITGGMNTFTLAPMVIAAAQASKAPTA